VAGKQRTPLSKGRSHWRDLRIGHGVPEKGCIRLLTFCRLQEYCCVRMVNRWLTPPARPFPHR
jgi:hypothetical protein